MKGTILAVVLIVAACGGCSTQKAQSSPASATRASPTALRPSSPRLPITSGSVVEYSVHNPSPDGSPPCLGCGTASLLGIVSGADGNLWFVDAGQRKVGRITPSGVITEFDVPGTSAVPDGITAAPDGNIWITAPNFGAAHPDWILRISAAGDVTRFPVGDAGVDGRPFGIAAGPDGNIWFTKFNADRIGRITPAGILTEFSLPPESGPRQIVAGPDDNMWFDQDGANHQYGAIARITPSGKVTVFSLNESYVVHSARAMVGGPDGNVCFGDASENIDLDRITPTGEITKFPFLSGFNSAEGLAVGPDGNLWFTNSEAGTVGRISLKGAIREFALPRRDARPLGIAAGADGRIWFTEEGLSRIASISVTVP
jgi:streptogramin lyase